MNLPAKKVTILVIAEQERLHSLFDFTKGLSDVRVKFATTLEQGLDSAITEAPALIFIQGRIAGLSGEIIARTISLELKEQKPKIVLFSNPEDTPEPGRKALFKKLDSSLDNDRLVLEVQSIAAGSVPSIKKIFAPVKKASAKKRSLGSISKVSRSKSSGAVQEPQQPAAAPPSTGATGEAMTGMKATAQPDEMAPAVVAYDISDVVKIGAGDSVLSGRLPDNTVSPAENKSGPSLFQEKLDTLLTKPDPSVVTANIPETEPDVFTSRLELPAVRARQAQSARYTVPGPGKRWRIGIIILGVAVVVVVVTIATFIFQGAGPARKKTFDVATENVDNTTGAAGRVPQKPEPLRTALPSFIPKQALDVQYGKTNPGWERYNGTSAEFKIFREKTIIRALQVIDRSGQGISTQFFNSILNEITGSPNYVVEVKESKGDFSIEKGQLAIKAKIIIYRKQPGAQVKAFVVDFR